MARQWHTTAFSDMLRPTVPDRDQVLATVLGDHVTDFTSNHSLAKMSQICKAMHALFNPILKRRMFGYNVHSCNFNALAVSDMKEYRRKLRESIVQSIKTVGTNTVHQYFGHDTSLYMIRLDNAFVGQVAVTPVRYWLKVEIYSRTEVRFVKQLTLRFFPTYDTQGKIVAVDNQVESATRMSYSSALDHLVQKIRAVCLA